MHRDSTRTVLPVPGATSPADATSTHRAIRRRDRSTRPASFGPQAEQVRAGVHALDPETDALSDLRPDGSPERLLDHRLEEHHDRARLALDEDGLDRLSGPSLEEAQQPV